MRVYKINCHSFIDVITNSSSELFVCTDNKIVEFFRAFLKKKNINQSFFEVQKFSDYKKEYDIDLEYMKEENPKEYSNMYGELSDDDYVLVCNVDSEEIYYQLPEFLEAINFKNIP